MIVWEWGELFKSYNVSILISNFFSVLKNIIVSILLDKFFIKLKFIYTYPAQIINL